jgi:hypothetical protein
MRGKTRKMPVGQGSGGWWRKTKDIHLSEMKTII